MEQTIGLVAGLTGSYTEVNSKPAGWLGARAGVVFNKRFTVGPILNICSRWAAA